MDWAGSKRCGFSGFVIAGGKAGGEGHIHVAAAGRTHSADHISPHLQLFLPSYGEFCLPTANFCSCLLLCLQGEVNFSFHWEVKPQLLLQVPWRTVSLPLCLQCKVYLVEDVLMTFLLSILERGGAVEAHPLIQQLMDLMWLLMEVSP